MLGLWGAADVQAQLNVVSRKKLVYQKIATEMSELGYRQTWEQCKTRIKNMIQKYKKQPHSYGCDCSPHMLPCFTKAIAESRRGQTGRTITKVAT